MRSSEDIVMELERRIKALQDAKDTIAKTGIPLVSEIETQTEIYNSILKFINSK